MSRLLVLLLVVSLGCAKQPDVNEAALQADYDRVLTEHKGHEALKYYCGTEVCKIEGNYQSKVALLAIYFKRQVVEPKNSEGGSLAEALIWRDPAGTWHTTGWQATPHALEEVKVTASFLQDSKPSASFKAALDLLLERKQEPVR